MVTAAEAAEAANRFAPKLPDAVKAQGDRALALQTNLVEGTIVAEAAPVTPQLVPIPPTQPPVVMTPEVPVPPTVVPITQPPADDWASKYNVLQGKYNSEMGGMRQALDSANATITHLNSLVEGQNQRIQVLENEKLPPGSPAAPATPPASQLVNPDDFEGYGEEVIELAKMVNNQSSVLNDLVAKMGQTDEKLEASTRDVFYQNLEAMVPGWDQINVVPQFVQWLQVVEPMSGEKRHDLLTRHFNAWDAAKVAMFFTSWMREAGIAPPAPTVPVNPAVTVPPVAAAPTAFAAPAYTPTVVAPIVPMAHPGLAGQVVVAPSVASNALPPGQQVVVVTREQFKKAAHDFTQGRITEAQYKAMADAFQVSIAQGLVR